MINGGFWPEQKCMFKMHLPLKENKMRIDHFSCPTEWSWFITMEYSSCAVVLNYDSVTYHCCQWYIAIRLWNIPALMYVNFLFFFHFIPYFFTILIKFTCHCFTIFYCLSKLHGICTDFVWRKTYSHNRRFYCQHSTSVLCWIIMQVRVEKTIFGLSFERPYLIRGLNLDLARKAKSVTLSLNPWI